ncbi:zinc finger protein 800 [Neodiprion pinetum]|uniref:Zinc finger protein 800 n=1 Tax=Neodiprion lecontei TaxID=441921 RepID=A0A6J0BFF0_NEOLC|nr:zinc finger protein 800 [Neodiprion lecontei]XP_046477474.1 zinc finger protein 800 [Neodiprion pinetum]
MKSVKPRTKTRKNNGKFGRVKFGDKESADISNPDLSQLRKPIDISVSSLLQVTKLLEVGGEEVKSMLAYECDVVYECRVCRSLFRSLANFISHKRVYCREKFNIALFRRSHNDHIISNGAFMFDPELAEDAECKEEDDNIRILRSQVVRNTLKKDLTSVVDMLQKKQYNEEDEDLSQFNSEPKRSKLPNRRVKLKPEMNKLNQEIVLEPIDTSKTAVYQTANVVPQSSALQAADLMKAQIIELQNMIGRNTAVVYSKDEAMDTNLLEKSDSPLQIYGSDDEQAESAESKSQSLVCSVCNAKFATRKTLTYHMKSLHVSYRKCYPCPCCNSTFANTWSVYRHLFKVHRKSNEQVRKLRAQIQEKAFRKETTGAEDIEKENAMTKSLSVSLQETSNTTQEWMDHFESDLELQRCGGCGRRFDRRAALVSHSQSCQKRIAACNEAATASKATRSEKTPSPIDQPSDSKPSRKNTPEHAVRSSQSNEKQVSQKIESPRIQSLVDTSSLGSEESPLELISNNETSIRVENVSRISNADWEMMGNNFGKISMNSDSFLSANSVFDKGQAIETDEEQALANKVPDSPEIIFTSMDDSRTVAISFGPKKRKIALLKNSSKDLSNSSESTNFSNKSENVMKSVPPSSEKQTFSTDHMKIMENRIAMIANVRKLQCLPCHRKFTSMTNLRRHMAIHIGWNRYRCRLCDFKCFVKCDCVAHCNKVHDAKNNRAVIADMVIQIPPDQSALAQQIMMDLSNPCENNPDPDIIEVTSPPTKEVDVVEVTSNSNSVEYLRDKTGEKDIKLPIEKSVDEDITATAKEHPREPNPSEHEGESSDSNPEETPQQTRSRLDKDPDLRKMVMEVIFGTAEGEPEPRPDPEIHRLILETKSCKATDSSMEINGDEDTRSSTEDNWKKSGNNSSTKEPKKRPTRIRVKPVNDDFIYDLTEVIRKDSAIHKATGVTGAQKTLKKKQSNQQQSSGETESDLENKSEAAARASVVQKLSSACKPLPIMQHKKAEMNNYMSKFSLRQAEVRLHPTDGLAVLNSVGVTNTPVVTPK